MSNDLASLSELERDKITESTLNRLQKRWEGSISDSWSILTAWQSNLDPTSNKTNMKYLQSFLRSKGYGYTKLKGVWEGESEPSFWVDGISFADTKNIAAKFNQEAVIYYGPDSQNKIVLVDKGGRTLTSFSKFVPNAVAQAYSKFKGRSFVFEFDDDVPTKGELETDSISGLIELALDKLIWD